MPQETFNVSKACKAQDKLIREKDLPYFPSSDGVCYRCGKNIYTQIDHGKYKSGISVEKAGTALVTGCPHCHRSYCD